MRDDKQEDSVTDENKQPEPDTPEQEQADEGKGPEPEQPKPQRKGGRKPKAPEPTLGQMVRYVTASGTVRPAVITRVRSEAVVDLTVFNSQGASPAPSANLDPEAGDPHTWHWPERN